MDSQGSFTRCMNSLKNGDSQAEIVIFERFVNRLMALASARLQAPLRSKLDPEDVVQSALGSFFDGHAHGKFHFDNWDSLWALLARITVRKYNRKATQLNAAKRSIDREIGMNGDWIQDLAAREPTPEEAVVCSDLLESILANAKAAHQEIILLKLQHYTNAEISEQTGRTERTVYRVLHRVRDQLRQLEEECEVV